jgi:hypothetical protein
LLAERLRRLEGFVLGKDVREHGAQHHEHSDPQTPIAVYPLFRLVLMLVARLLMMVRHGVDPSYAVRKEEILGCPSIASGGNLS